MNEQIRPEQTFRIQLAALHEVVETYEICLHGFSKTGLKPFTVPPCIPAAPLCMESSLKAIIFCIQDSIICPKCETIIKMEKKSFIYILFFGIMILHSQNTIQRRLSCRHCVAHYTWNPWLENQMVPSEPLDFLRTWYN